MLGVAVFR